MRLNGLTIRLERPRARVAKRFIEIDLPTLASDTTKASTSRLWLFSALATADLPASNDHSKVGSVPAWTERAQLGQRGAKFGEPLYGAFVVCSDRRDHHIGRYEGVNREHSEVRRRVDDDQVVVAFEIGESLPKSCLSCDLPHQRHLDASEIA